jgi:hypothetical protein
VEQCPKSIISAESIALLQQYQAWKMFGCPNPQTLPAKTVDGLLILGAESRNGEI